VEFSGLAEDAATAIEHRDALCDCRLATAGDEVAAASRQLLGILFAQDWSHDVEQAVYAALIGHYYDRFGDHAVAIARQVCYLATGHLPQGSAVGTAHSCLGCARAVGVRPGHPTASSRTVRHLRRFDRCARATLAANITAAQAATATPSLLPA